MSGIVILDLLMRGASIGIFALLLARLVSKKPLRFLEFSFALLVISLIIYVVASSPTPLVGRGTVSVTLLYAPVLAPFLLWWAGMAFFDDEYGPKPWHALPAALVIVPVLLRNIVPGVEYVRTVVIVALYGHLILAVIRSGDADLVEERRRFRRWFIVFAVLFGMVVEFAEVSSVDHDLPLTGFPYQAAGVLVLVAAFAFWALRISGAAWQPRVLHARAPETIRPKDGILLGRLQREMDAGIWREEGLSVGGLAARLGVPEHQVRRSINQGLGYRNFASFVNERRVGAACTALGDPEQANKPILSVAFDVGFASIGPFNRAFRTIKGESPSEYRARKLAKAG